MCLNGVIFVLSSRSQIWCLLRMRLQLHVLFISVHCSCVCVYLYFWHCKPGPCRCFLVEILTFKLWSSHWRSQAENMQIYWRCVKANFIHWKAFELRCFYSFTLQSYCLFMSSACKQTSGRPNHDSPRIRLFFTVIIFCGSYVILMDS